MVVSCSFVCLCCGITLSFLLIGASSHPCISLHFEVLKVYYCQQVSSTFVGPNAITDRVHHVQNLVLCNAMSARLKYVLTAKRLT